MEMNKYGPTDWGFKDFDLLEGYNILKAGHTRHITTQWGVRPIEGGLTFLLEKGGVQYRAIFGYTELGEWLEVLEPYHES